MYLTSLATNTPFNLTQKVSIAADDTKQNKEGNNLQGLTSLATNTPINLIQKVSIIADDTKQNEEGNSLRGNTLNNANGVSDAEDAKVRMLRQIV